MEKYWGSDKGWVITRYCAAFARDGSVMMTFSVPFLFAKNNSLRSSNHNKNFFPSLRFSCNAFLFLHRFKLTNQS